ncbi:MAG: glycosyltransferase family 2 protein [Dysgonamonadaceae bacterium]|nr:glycosyltransferase family 2 protein [Dysgonamonadaceae bacterium]
MNLSVGLITHNEEKKLTRTLKAIKDIAGEIVIVDSGSSDKTVEIARSFGANVFVEPWKGFGMQKNSVIDKCRGKWILLIDADEEVTPELKEHIRIITDSQTPQHEVYKIQFRSVCFGKEIKHGGWSGFYRIRLFRNGAGRYDNRQVHESFVTSASIGIIQKDIIHYTYENLEEYFEKFNSYTSKMAMQYREKAKKKSVVSIYLGAKFNFFKSYILQLGFLDGYEGYLLSKAGAMYMLVKYSKLRELNK